ncbi:ATP-binding cassette subfamily B protein [Mobilisporobacter senegalensis]|uniref:ATP-binding cassette subfamily B protein n=1 Tax=Mobilisporobacter senegalensis TaxID=1329262 RepID=A0A3N1XGK7_9FIRM|nr:ABC transporter ATP-binding protein [Mobilisporobacter senegalensis]ROR23947.1 ATP-binding cassette subfamily B protein [Mobilisporobacter senegalensis]
MKQKSSVAAKPKTGMARLMELAATKKPLMIASVILSGLASVASFIPHIAIYFVVREIMGIFPEFGNLDLERTVGFGWLAFGGILLNILLYFAALMCSHLAAFGTLYELKVNFASHLAKVPLGFHVLVGSGKLRKIMDENIEKIEGFIAHQLPDMVASFVAPVVMFAILLVIDWRFGLAAAAGIILALAIQIKAYGNDGAKNMMENYQSALEDMNNASVEYIRGITVVKAFKQTVYSFRRMHSAIKEYTKMVIPYTLSWENYMSAFTTIINNIYLCLIPVGILVGLNTSDYNRFAVTFIFYLIFVPSIATILMKIMYVSTGGMQIIGGVERMDEILHTAPLPQPEDPKETSGHEIVFKEVSFSYAGQEAEALSSVSFRAEENQITAIVGPSGGGKSTIAHLIPRFFDVTEGAIWIGGVDVRHMKSEYLMEKVSFVFQDVFLFKQSIMDNIRLGNQSATDEQVIAAAKAAQCHEFIEKLPEKYHTVIGTKGVHLSGGEQQRIAIARAIVKNAPIVLLDEATAFSDPENEHLIQQAFKKLMQGKTVIMIAHRLSTIRSANKIVVLDKGRLIEQGTHDELLLKHGKYSDMWNMYTKTLDWKMDRKGGKAHV